MPFRDSAQERMSEQSCMLISMEVLCWSSRPAQLIFCNMASSTAARVLVGGGKGGTATGTGAGADALSPEAAPSQCSGRGTWRGVCREEKYSGEVTSSGLEASWRSRTCDRAACAFRARVGEKEHRHDPQGLILPVCLYYYPLSCKYPNGKQSGWRIQLQFNSLLSSQQFLLARANPVNNATMNIGSVAVDRAAEHKYGNNSCFL